MQKAAQKALLFRCFFLLEKVFCLCTKILPFWSHFSVLKSVFFPRTKSLFFFTFFPSFFPSFFFLFNKKRSPREPHEMINSYLERVLYYDHITTHNFTYPYLTSNRPKDSRDHSEVAARKQQAPCVYAGKKHRPRWENGNRAAWREKKEEERSRPYPTSLVGEN